MKKSFVTALLVAFTIAWVAVSAMPVPAVASAGPQSSDSVVVNPASIIDLPERVKDWSGKEHKQGYFENKDAHSTRPYMDSCLAALQLMVYYRYLPTTSLAAGGVEDDIKDASSTLGKDDSSDVKVIVDL